MSDLPGIRAAQQAAPAAPSATDLVPPSPRQDDDARWLTPLASSGPAHARAVRELHLLLLRASTFEVGRRSAALGLSTSSELDDIANQAADDALLAIVSCVSLFQGRRT